MELTEGRKVDSVGFYGPADIEYRSQYWDMTIVMENGQMAGIPWIKAVHRSTDKVTMLNCAQCACITLMDEL